MRLKRYLLPTTLALGLAALVIAPTVLGADYFGLDTAVGGTHIPTSKNLAQIIGGILQTALGFVGTLFLLLMVYAGFKWMTARGEEKHIKEAKDMIMGAVIGLVVIAGAYALTSFVLSAVTGSATSSPTNGGSTTGLPLGASCTTDGECDSNLCGPTSRRCERQIIDL